MTGRLGEFVESYGRALVIIVLSFALAGILCAFQLPIAILPETNFPRIIILVDNGIAPVDVQMLTVTRPIEEAVRIVPGITDVRSKTGRGATEINLFFRWDVDILNALHLVQGRIAQIAPTLPPNTRFYINRLTFYLFPTVGCSITSPTRSIAELWDLAYYDIAPRLYRLPGVAESRIVGGRPPEFHVLVQPERLNALGMPLTKVVDSIRNTNTITAAGMIQENFHLYLTTVTGLIHDKEQIENIVVDVVKGTPIRVKDIARVEPGEQVAYKIVTANGRQAVLVNVMQQPDGNSVAIADAVNAELAQIRKTLPPDIVLENYYDESLLVRDSIRGVAESILIGLVLSIVVLVAFLKNWRTTVVAVLVIPIAVLFAVVFLRLFNMSWNLMTLGGLAACIGVVIDDAIVMVENIVVHLSMGQTPAEASRSAIHELTPALIGSTLTPIVVFVPLVFLGGITAVFFRALAMTLVTALFASLFLAIFFTPILARVFFRKPQGPAETDIHRAEQAGEGRFLRFMTERYEVALGWVLRHTGTVLLASVLIIAGAVAIYFQLGSGFLPQLDEGTFVLDYKTPPGTSLEETNRILMHVEQFIRETPEVESYSRRTGAELGFFVTEPNEGDFAVKLLRKRKRGLQEVIDELRAKIEESEPILEIEFPHMLEDLIGDLVSAPQPVEIKVYNDEYEVAKQFAKDIEEWLPKVQGTEDIINRTLVIGPSVNFRVNPEKAQRAGFSVTDIAEIESAMVDGAMATNMIRGQRLIGVRVRYPLEYRSTVDGLKRLLLTSPNGTSVPLSSIADVEMEEGTTEILRENLRNIATITSQISGRDLGSVIAEIKDRMPKELKVPPGTEIEFGGLYQVQRESFLGLSQVLLASILLIFIILVFEFRSFSHPIAILVATLLCSFGSLLALYITRQTLNISSFMGAIMVVGIVHKNGILMLDAEKEFSARGLPLQEAIYEAGRRRLRPIVMTALATIFGMLPLALNVGAGAQILQPLAIAVIGGVAISMVLSLLITPVLYFRLRHLGL